MAHIFVFVVFSFSLKKSKNKFGINMNNASCGQQLTKPLRGDQKVLSSTPCKSYLQRNCEFNKINLQSVLGGFQTF